MEPRRYVATNLKAVLDRQGIPSSVIAREIHRSPSLVSLALKGKRTLSQEDAENIANLLRLPFDLLFDVTDRNDTASTRERKDRTP